MKLAVCLNSSGKIFVLDEPSDGLHMKDIDRMLQLFQKLVDDGNTLFLIEHNLDLIRAADYVIELGPEGGRSGGDSFCRNSGGDDGLRTVSDGSVSERGMQKQT